jgi:hypothetical protein
MDKFVRDEVIPSPHLRLRTFHRGNAREHFIRWAKRFCLAISAVKTVAVNNVLGGIRKMDTGQPA